MRRFDDALFCGVGRFSTARIDLLHKLLDRAISDLSAAQQGAFEFSREEHAQLAEAINNAALDIATALTGRKVTLGRRISIKYRSKIQQLFRYTATKELIGMNEGLDGSPVEIVDPLND